MAQDKEYFAFISYQREDEKWAKWLQHKLEHYHIPTNVRKENPSLPQSIRPVFKDTSELAAGVLADEIHEALENSKYLIVICSPRAAQSIWVGKEVQTFIDMGRSDKIIPFVIGGKPFSENPEEECFPSTLLNLPKEQELLGVNINEMGRDAAVIKVVARMFDLKFDTLWQRYEREQRQKRWMWIGGSVLLMLLGLSIGGYFVRQNNVIREQKGQLEESNARQAAAIWSMKINKSRFVAEKASELVDEGDSFLARRLLMEVLPLDSTEYPYTPEAERALRKAVQSENAILRGHTRGVNTASYSPNGQFVVSASSDNTVRLWDVNTGKMVGNPYIGHEIGVLCAIISPDGKQIASASRNGTIIIWTIAPDEKDRKSLVIQASKASEFYDVVKGETAIRYISYSPNGEYLVSATCDSIKIWDVKTGNKREKQ